MPTARSFEHTLQWFASDGISRIVLVSTNTLMVAASGGVPGGRLYVVQEAIDTGLQVTCLAASHRRLEGGGVPNDLHRAVSLHRQKEAQSASAKPPSGTCSDP